MRHVSITCKNHPDLRWSCKSIAWSNGYNGSRRLFFNGVYKGRLYADGSGTECDRFAKPECSCSADELTLAPEDAEIAKRFAEKEAAHKEWQEQQAGAQCTS
jgi:hypothetical protein